MRWRPALLERRIPCLSAEHYVPGSLQPLLDEDAPHMCLSSIEVSLRVSTKFLCSGKGTKAERMGSWLLLLFFTSPQLPQVPLVVRTHRPQCCLLLAERLKCRDALPGAAARLSQELRNHSNPDCRSQQVLLRLMVLCVCAWSSFDGDSQHLTLEELRHDTIRRRGKEILNAKTNLVAILLLEFGPAVRSPA